MIGLKKLGAAFGVSAVSLGMMATSAMASTSFVNTGDWVSLHNNRTTTTTVTVRNTNNAYVSQYADNDVDTGDNDANRNIGGGNIRTGSAYISNYFSVRANSNSTNIRL